MTAASLIILAAGLGSRFGGTKQLTPVGPDGEVILDYAARDARAAGFQRAVLVVRSDIEAEVRAHVSQRWPAGLTWEIVCQDRDALAIRAAAAGRSKPLGTAHAVSCGVRGGRVDGPFAVVNADDLYGSAAYRLLADHFASTPGSGALVTYAVGGTIVERGAVTRALCDVDGGLLRTLEEGTVTFTNGTMLWTGVSGRQVTLSGNEPVSMNCWGFPREVVDAFDDACRRFVASDRVATGDEVLLPDMVRTQLAAGMTFVALASDDRCIGVTHAGDVTAVRDAIARSTP
jgi:MobA-like NTP transferase protein